MGMKKKVEYKQFLSRDMMHWPISAYTLLGRIESGDHIYLQGEVGNVLFSSVAKPTHRTFGGCS